MPMSLQNMKMLLLQLQNKVEELEKGAPYKKKNKEKDKPKEEFSLD